MICDEDPLRRRPRESTARRKRQERCVWMARKMTEWPSKRGPITKIMPSDGCIGDTVPLAVGKWYDFHEFGWYMGNVGLFGSFAVKHSTITDELIFRQLGISGRLPIYGVLITFFLSALVEVGKHSPDPVIRYMPILVAPVMALLFRGIEISSSKFSFLMELNTAFVIAVVGWIIVTFPLLFLGLGVRTLIWLVCCETLDNY